MADKQDINEASLPRLNFQNGSYDPEENEGFLTCAVQGKMIYLKLVDGKPLIYTQGRDDLPKRMFIRGKEIPLDDFTPQLEIFYPLCEKFPDISVVAMICRQDLLITHRSVDGTQIFFLGCIIDDHGFVPADVLKEQHTEIKQLAIDHNIESLPGYGKPGRIYIPALIRTAEDLSWVIENQGCFVKTVDGVPVTIYTEDARRRFELMAETQNNIQLFIKLFFLSDLGKSPERIEDLEERMGSVAEFSPDDKTEEFVVLLEKFKELLSFFTRQKVCFGLVRKNTVVSLQHDSLDDQELRMMEKPTKALGTLLKNINFHLRKNSRGGVKPAALHVQVVASIFSFFVYENNVNNCCHLLKHVERLTVG